MASEDQGNDFKQQTDNVISNILPNSDAVFQHQNEVISFQRDMLKLQDELHDLQCRFAEMVKLCPSCSTLHSHVEASNPENRNTAHSERTTTLQDHTITTDPKEATRPGLIDMVIRQNPVKSCEAVPKSYEDALRILEANEDLLQLEAKRARSKKMEQQYTIDPMVAQLLPPNWSKRQQREDQLPGVCRHVGRVAGAA